MSYNISEIIGAPTIHGAYRLADDIATNGYADKFVLFEPRLWVGSREATALSEKMDKHVITPKGFKSECFNAFRAGGYLVLAAVQITQAEIDVNPNSNQDGELWKESTKLLRPQLETDLGIEEVRPSIKFWSLTRAARNRHPELACAVDRLGFYFEDKHRGIVGLCAEMGAGFVLHSLDVCWDRVCDDIADDKHLEIRFEDTKED